MNRMLGSAVRGCYSQNPGKRICTAPRSNLPRTSCSVSFTIPSNAAWMQSCHSDVSPWYTRLAYEVLPTAISEALDARVMSLYGKTAYSSGFSMLLCLDQSVHECAHGVLLQRAVQGASVQRSRRLFRQTGKNGSLSLVMRQRCCIHTLNRN